MNKYKFGVLAGLFIATVAKYLFFHGSLVDVAAFSMLGALLFLYDLKMRDEKLEKFATALKELKENQASSQQQVTEIINYFNISKVKPVRMQNGQQKTF